MNECKIYHLRTIGRYVLYSAYYYALYSTCVHNIYYVMHTLLACHRCSACFFPNILTKARVPIIAIKLMQLRTFLLEKINYQIFIHT